MITTENLSFSYTDKSVLKNINLKVPKGSIYGYLGKNGSGKSTTIKILLGLLRAQSGSIRYDSHPFTANTLYRIGNLIESPSFYSHLTAYENLKYLDIVFHRGEDRITEVLSLVDLNGARDKKAKKFSSGMKQRLGIALALFHNPDILILDEPLNGLDPEGIHDMRKLIVRLHNEGKTILLSSHILSEIEKVCTHIGILDDGLLIYQGSIHSLKTDELDLESVFLTLTSHQTK